MSPPERRRKGRGKTPRPSYRKQARAKAKQASPEERAAPLRAPERREPGPVVSLDPLAPIIVRSGRPLEGKSDPDPARFPPPSTVAGCLRTAWARETGRPFGPELARLTVAGPLLLDRENRILAPKPADALYFGHGGSARCVRAEPGAFEPGCGADPPEALLPDAILDFLAETATEVRARIALDPETGAVKPGALWYEENLPAEAVLWGVFALSASNNPNDPRSEEDRARAMPASGTLLQLGGKAGAGRGLVRFLTGEAPA